MLAAVALTAACGKSDADLTKAVTDRLAADKVSGVTASVKDGVATLTGEVADVTGTLHIERGGVDVASIPVAASVTVGATFADADRSDTRHGRHANAHADPGACPNPVA